MFVAARGAIIEDRDFMDFLGHCWRYSELETQIMTEVIAKCGYGLCFVQPEVELVEEPVVDTPLLLEYDGFTTNNTEVEAPITMDDFIQQANLYGTYKSMDQLDFIIDIVDRCNPHHDDPEETYQALQEIRRLAVEAIMWGEMTTEDNDEDNEPSDEDRLFGFDGMDERGGDDDR
jgi:hypothetical protein